MVCVLTCAMGTESHVVQCRVLVCRSTRMPLSSVAAVTLLSLVLLLARTTLGDDTVTPPPMAHVTAVEVSGVAQCAEGGLWVWECATGARCAVRKVTCGSAMALTRVVACDTG